MVFVSCCKKFSSRKEHFPNNELEISKFRGIISGGFEPYMGLYIEKEDQ